MNTLRLAMIGGGNMGRALIGGLLARGALARHLHVCESKDDARQRLARDFGVPVTGDPRTAVDGAGVVVLAVKPQDMAAAVAPLQAELVRARPLVVSVAAGLRVAAIERWCGPGVAVVRAMPNRPALVGAGVTGLYAPPSVSRAQRDLASRVLAAVGSAVWVDDEDHLDVVTAVSGSGPAYFFLLAEALEQAGIAAGLDASTARTLATGTLSGSGELARRSDGDLARLRIEVTSRGGTTEAALRTLAAADFAGAVARAVEAAAHRSRELAEEFGKQV